MARDSCFAWTADSAATWRLATGDEPGRMWIIGAQDDDRFNRVESVGALVTSTWIDVPPFASVEVAPRIPDGSTRSNRSPVTSASAQSGSLPTEACWTAGGRRAARP